MKYRAKDFDAFMYERRRYSPRVPGLRSYGTKGKSKFRFYIWVIATICMISVLAIGTNFIERCNALFIFEGLTFKFSMVFLFSFIFMIFLCFNFAYNVRNRRIHFLIKEHRVVFFLTLLFGLTFITLFSIAIHPAYREATIVFSVLSFIFTINLGCIILLD